LKERTGPDLHRCRRIALYGKPYIKAAKDTWNLFKDRGIDALVNDCLINNIWSVPASFYPSLLSNTYS
jgi:hypothetical protein